MSMRVNTNVLAIQTQHNLEKSADAQQKAMERLSSGLRINNASDDPAGLTVSEGLRAQINGMNQAISNTQNANNLIKTAEGGLTEINSLLNSVRQLAVHAANTGVNDSTALTADQSQIASALTTINNIATRTKFGTKSLLDGSAGTTTLVTDTSHISGMTIGSSFGGAVTASGNATVVVNNAASKATAFGTTAATYASLNATLAMVSGGSAGTGGSVVLNGQVITASATDTVQGLIDKINAKTTLTGVSADFSTANGSTVINLKQTNFGANYKIQESETANLIFGTSANGTVMTGSNATVTVTIGGATATFVGGRSATDDGLRLTDTAGNSMLLTTTGNSAGSTYSAGTVTSNTLQFQVGFNTTDTAFASLGNLQASQLGTTAVAGKNLSLIDVTTASGASDAMKVIDEAISYVSTLRANLGALQKNTLESTIRYVGVGVENLSASESQIRDTDIAAEVGSMTKNQILQQAGMSVLAQANQAPQQVLSLLR